MAAIRLPRLPCCVAGCGSRPGRARAARGPRCARRASAATCCSPPATTVSTTSLTVPPNAFLTSLKSSSSSRTNAKPPVRADRRRSAASRAPGSAPPRRPRRRPRAPRAPASSDVGRAARRGGRAAGELERRPHQPADPARGEVERARLGVRAPTARPRAGSCGGTGSASNSTVARSTPEMPSTSAWWVLEISAKRLPSSPWTSHVSHSGFARSSRWEWMRAASARSCSSRARRAAARCGGRGTRG